MTPKKAFIIISGLVALTILGGATVYYFADKYLSTKAKEISTLKAELEIVEFKIANARNAESELERLSFIKEVANDVLPPEKIQSDVVGELIEFARQTNTRLGGINFQPTDAGPAVALSQTKPLEGVPGVNTLPITLTVNARYEDLLRFLQQLEGNRRKMQVENMTLAPEESTGRINSNIEINVYVRTK